MIFELYFLLFLSLGIAWNFKKIKDDKYNNIIFGLLAFIVLILIVTFRNGNRLPDYIGYVEMFYNPTIRPVENSFIIIAENIRKYSNSPIWLFFCYALISVSIKYFAIRRASYAIFYSLAVWIASFLLLQEMIQIRGAIAGSLLLCLIPFLYSRKFIISIIIIIVAFWFHRAALAFLLILFINPHKENWKFWIIIYTMCALINILKINIFQFLGLSDFLSMIKVMDGDYYDLSKQSDYLNIYAPYILLQTLTCLVCMYNSKKIQQSYPYGVCCIKICFLGVLIYSLPMGVISLRLAEMFSTVFIFTYPLLLLCFKKKYEVFSKISVSVICLFLLTNFIFIKGFIK